MINRSAVAIVSLALLSAVARADFDAPTSATVPSISVSGTATVFVVPDRVDVRFGVEVFNAELAAARKDHDDRVRKVLAAVAAAGVATQDVQTTHANVSPEYDSDQYGRVRFDQRRGFRVTKSIGVTLRDATKLDALVNTVMEAGATTIDGVTFDSSEILKHRETARRDAAKAAKQKAESIATMVNAKVGRALRLVESSPQTFPMPMAYNMASYDRAAPSDGGDAPSTFALGQLEVKVTVDATFELTQ
ncbi:MAG: SIMPL domain-containing protein [Phycisphaerae bacterium]|nr:SIMPL domain-containing protein [Phycisphaerae bacterium]